MERFRFGPDDARRSDRVDESEWQGWVVDSNPGGTSGEIKGDSGTGDEGLRDGDGLGELAFEALDVEERSVSSLAGVRGRLGPP
jgi:hypothetical protein